MNSTAIFFFLFALLRVGWSLKDPICGQEPAFNGHYFFCTGRLPMYTYFPNWNACQTFDYKGCSGNDNRFDTLDDCERRCKSIT